MNNFLQELKKRNVIKAAIAYAVVSWIILQILSTLLPNFGAPEWVFKTLTLLIFIGFPIWIVFAWIYEVTDEGLKKTSEVSETDSISGVTNKRFNVLIVIGLLVAISILLLKPNQDVTSEVVETATEKEISIAVLPFDDMSSGGDSQWFCDGMTEDILTHLSKVSELRVISRTSVMRYKNHKKTIPEIAKELGVTHILEGSVRKQNNNVLITAQLIQANDEHLWADNFNENLDNVFKVQSDISKKIVEQLRITLTPEEEKSINAKSTDNTEAYEFYLKGRWNDGTKEGYAKSIKLLQQAIALDPNFSDAYATIGYLTLTNAYAGLMDYKEGLTEAKQYIDKALKINPKNTIAFNSNVRYYQILGDWEKVRENAEKALELNPNSFDSRMTYAGYFLIKPIVELDKYLDNITIAQKLDPFSSNANTRKIIALLYNKKINEAEAHYTKMKFSINKGQHDYLKMMIKIYKNKDQTLLIKERDSLLKKFPENPYLHRNLGNLYLEIAHDYTTSLYHYKKAYELSPPNYSISNQYFYALLYKKEFKEAERLLNDKKFMEVFNGDRPNYIYFDYHYYKGEYQEALVYLEKHEKNSQYYINKAAVHAYLGDKEIVSDVINNKMNRHYMKALIYAIQENRDSMYFHLHKIAITRASQINNYPEFDKYRKEPKFIEFLINNNLPTDN